MHSESTSLPALTFQPLTAERWPDLEVLFGANGADDGCWCMWWRVTRAEFEKQKGEANKQAMKRIVDSGQVPGIIAYNGVQPIAWCSIGPREAFPTLQRSRKLRRVDNAPVWSVVCFYVAEPFRRKGIMVPLLQAAVEHARAHGATVVEGYPVEPARVRTPGSGYMGLMPAFQQLGFAEVLRRSEDQAIMRLRL